MDVKERIFGNSRNRMMMAFIFMIIIPIMTLSYLVFNSSQHEIEENFIDSTHQQVAQIDDYIIMYLKDLSQDCAFLAQNSTVKKADDSITEYMNMELNVDGQIPMTASSNGGIEAEIYDIYESYAETHNDVVCVYIGTEYGGYVQWPESKLERRYDPRKRSWYEDIMSEKDGVIITSPYYAIATDDLAVITTGKVIENDKGEVVGIQAVDVSLNGLTEIIKNKRIGQSGFVILMDADGTILAHPKNPELNFTNISELNSNKLSEISDVNTDSFTMELDGKVYFADIYTSKNTGWKYMSLIEQREIMQSVNQIRNMILMLATALTTVFIILAFVFSNRFSRPLMSAMKQLKLIESGDYSSEIPEELLLRKDDLGSFIKAVDSMQNVICDLMGKVEDVTDSKIEDPSFLADMKAQTEDASLQVASALEKFAKLAENEARDKHEIEKKLEKTKVSLLQAQEIAQIWTWEWDVSQGTFLLSDAMRDILQLDDHKESYTIDEFLTIVHQEDRNYFKKALNCMWKGESICIEFRYLKQDGDEVWVYLNGNVVNDDSGKIIGLLVMNHDITERKATLNKLRRMNQNLREMVKEEVEENRKKDAVIVYQSRLAKMGQMIGLITHQWKQPLNNLSLIFANLKESSEYDELTKTELIDSMEDSKRIITQMAQTIDDFRYFFNPNNQWEIFSINDTVNFGIELIEESVKLNNITIHTELYCTRLVNGYSNEFSQVLFNILDNAKDAMLNNVMADRQIQIRSYDDNENAVIEIVNNGGHIDDHVMENLFEPYFTTKGHEKGTGIGLYMSKMIIEKHMNGQIKCINVENGVMFKIIIPVNGVI